tara:strand:+ start:182 stop:307 length:126 start_codon:yes stop_codon:yes gene_type:complete
MDAIVKLAGSILSMGVGIVLIAFGIVLLCVLTDTIYKQFFK